MLVTLGLGLHAGLPGFWVLLSFEFLRGFGCFDFGVSLLLILLFFPG